MAMRLRLIDGKWRAFCAADTEACDGDVYLDDGKDHAIREKLQADWESEGILIESSGTPLPLRGELGGQIRCVIATYEDGTERVLGHPARLGETLYLIPTGEEQPHG